MVSWAIVNRSRWVYVTRLQRRARLEDLIGKLLLMRLPLTTEALRIAFVCHAALHDGHALPRLGDAVHVDAKGETIQELRPQVALLRVHRADEHEAGGVTEADALALHHVHAHCRRVEQQIDNVVIQQIDFIHVEQAAIGRGEHPRLEMPLAMLNGLLDVQRAYHPILGGADRQIHKAGTMSCDRQHLAARQAIATVIAQGVDAAGVAGERTIGHYRDLGQEIGQRARRGRLRSAALAADQHAADRVADGVQDQGALHALLADDGGERIGSDNRHVIAPGQICVEIIALEGWKLETGDWKLEAGDRGLFADASLPCYDLSLETAF